MEGDVTVHLLRRTAAAAMHRVGGPVVAAEFLGHHTPDDSSFTYVRTPLGAVAREVCDAFSIRTGEDHPLATPGLFHED